MNWGSWQQFWEMGGYGPYVWGAYGTLAVLIAAEIASLRLHLARARRPRTGRRTRKSR